MAGSGRTVDDPHDDPHEDPHEDPTMATVIAALAGTVLAFMELVRECAEGNVIHVENGRPPNAGAAVFPAIPVIPALAVLASWLLGLVHPALSPWGVVALVGLYVPPWICRVRSLNVKPRSMQDKGDR